MLDLGRYELKNILDSDIVDGDVKEILSKKFNSNDNLKLSLLVEDGVLMASNSKDQQRINLKQHEKPIFLGRFDADDLVMQAKDHWEPRVVEGLKKFTKLKDRNVSLIYYPDYDILSLFNDLERVYITEVRVL